MPELNIERREKDEKYLRDVCSVLRENFDTVQVFVTRHSDEERNTVNAHWGSGNYFARYGHVRQWCKEQEQPSTEE